MNGSLAPRFHQCSAGVELVWGAFSGKKSFETQTLLAGVGVISMQRNK